MMGSAPPSQSTLSDLKVLLELLQAAQDTKKAKAAIDSISDARKQYDDAIAEANARIAAASEAEKASEVAAAKAEAAESKADKKLAALSAASVEAKSVEIGLKEDRESFEIYKAEVAKQAQANADEKIVMDAEHQKRLADVAKKMAEIDALQATLLSKTEQAEMTKLDYEERIAKLKAIAA